MRKAFCDGLVQQQLRSEFIFLTGDLGFKSLEPLRDALGPRFINAGVAEQNMISVAAGLARKGLRPWAYSIAPFIFARPFEQIRNDVCLHRLPVVMVGNGGGYGYGVMGGTHHALEDYGVMLTLADMQAFVPAFDSDISDVTQQLFERAKPSYLRLGLSEEPKGLVPPPFAPWRKLTSGSGGTVITVGPLAGSYWGRFRELPVEQRPNLWTVCQLPIGEIPLELKRDLLRDSTLVIAEEHVAQGSVGQALAMQMIQESCVPFQVTHLTALGYPSGRYGSQSFHRLECGLDVESVLAALTPDAIPSRLRLVA
jgi:transketolase